jgi:transcriptional regulator with XRE-family HTH domain
MFEDRLAYVREKRGYTQAELADMVNLSSQQIYRYENAKTEPDAKIVARIARALRVSTDYLLGLTDSPIPYIDADLRENEREALEAWRRGDKYEAIKVIVEDDFA